MRAYRIDQEVCGPLLAKDGRGVHSQMATEGKLIPVMENEMETETFTKGAHPMNAQQPQGYEPTSTAKTLNCFNNSEARAEELIASKTQYHYAVRRITPTEGERLQGFSEGQCMYAQEMTKDEYAAWQLAKGNLIADCENGKVYCTRGPGGIKLAEPKLLPGSNCIGYRVITSKDCGIRYQLKLHRVIWIAAHGVPPPNMAVDHINNNKSDNRICNLQLLTKEENSSKAHADGLVPHHHKLDEEQVGEIIHLHEEDKVPMRKLAKMFGVSKSRIHQLIHADGWTRPCFTPDQITDALVDRFVAIHQNWAVINGKPDAKPKSRKWVRDWLTKISSAECPDGPRYKAIGNSMSVNVMSWIGQRIQMEEN